jgi:hypothetical protein
MATPLAMAKATTPLATRATFRATVRAKATTTRATRATTP